MMYYLLDSAEQNILIIFNGSTYTSLLLLSCTYRPHLPPVAKALPAEPEVRLGPPPEAVPVLVLVLVARRRVDVGVGVDARLRPPRPPQHHVGEPAATFRCTNNKATAKNKPGGGRRRRRGFIYICM